MTGIRSWSRATGSTLAVVRMAKAGCPSGPGEAMAASRSGAPSGRWNQLGRRAEGGPSHS